MNLKLNILKFFFALIQPWRSFRLKLCKKRSKYSWLLKRIKTSENVSVDNRLKILERRKKNRKMNYFRWMLDVLEIWSHLILRKFRFSNRNLFCAWICRSILEWRIQQVNSPRIYVQMDRNRFICFFLLLVNEMIKNECMNGQKH